MSLRPLPLTLVAQVVLVAACAGAAPTAPDADRMVWLQQTLAMDYYPWLLRDPALTAEGLRKMALTPHDFLRGSAGLFAADATTPGAAGYVPTRYGSPAAAQVRVVGDPHYENLGTFRASDGTLLADFNDFDGATFGPYWLDVRRFALSIALVHLAGEEQAGLDPAARDAVIAAAAEGYVDEIDRLASGAPAAVERAEAPSGVIFADALEHAGEDGDGRAELDDYTLMDGGDRVLRYGEIAAPAVEGIVSDVLAPVSAAEERLVRRLLAAYPATLLLGHEVPAAAVAIKGIGRRYGAGVRSFALLRYYVLVEGPTASPDDDVLLELKEAGDPLVYRGLLRLADQIYPSNAARQVAMQRYLQQRPDADPWLGWAAEGALSFKVRDRTKYQRGLAVDRFLEKVTSGKWSDDDLEALARQAGRLLARAHALAPGLDGAPGLAAIQAALGGDDAGFVAETLAFVDGYLPQLLADHRGFQRLIGDEPYLGLR